MEAAKTKINELITRLDVTTEFEERVKLAIKPQVDNLVQKSQDANLLVQVQQELAKLQKQVNQDAAVNVVPAIFNELKQIANMGDIIECKNKVNTITGTYMIADVGYTNPHAIKLKTVLAALSALQTETVDDLQAYKDKVAGIMS